MPKHRSFKLEKFIKSADDALLREYFRKWDVSVPGGLVFDSGEGFDRFWDGIEDDRRSEIDDQMHCINDIADRTRDYVQYAVEEFGITTVEDESSETTALRVFLHSTEAFDLAYDRYLYVIYSDKLKHTRFIRGTANFEDTVFGNLESDIKAYFLENGKSDQCRIRKYEDNDKFFTLVARGDFMKAFNTFQDGDIKVRTFRPAEEDILVFDKRNQILSIKVGGKGRGDKEKQRYLEMFSKRVMGIDTLDDSVFDNRIVSLDPIKNRTFSYNGNEHIESVKLVRADSKQRATRVTVSGGDVGSVFESYGLGRDTTEMVSVKLRFLVRREDRKSKAFTVEIRPPETTRIKERNEKMIIEDYLHENGVLLFRRTG